MNIEKRDFRPPQTPEEIQEHNLQMLRRSKEIKEAADKKKEAPALEQQKEEAHRKELQAQAARNRAEVASGRADVINVEDREAQIARTKQEIEEEGPAAKAMSDDKERR